MITKKKYRKSFLKKFGLGFPKIATKNVVWIHAVSVGETKAVVPLAKELKKDHSIHLLVTSGTETGHATAIQELPFADSHAYLPLDFFYIIRPIVKKIQPSLLLISETDLWFSLQKSAKEYGAKIVLVNGKISERSTSRLKKVPFFSRSLFDTIDYFCVQGEIYKSRFLSLGIASSKIVVTGNLKIMPPPSLINRETWRRRLGISQDTVVLTCGSTHASEEIALLDLVEDIPNVKILLVPRHPDRFDKVAALLEKKGISYSRFTKNSASLARVTLVDKMGILNICYSLSDIAFVGGTLTKKVGGHNLIEPCFFGVPVLYGPHIHAQPDLFELLTKFEAGAPLAQLRELLISSQKRKCIGKNGLKLTREYALALPKTISTISLLFEKSYPDKIGALPRDGAVVSSLGS
ncbi:MAG: 3-deoxy-D-manno-octulosonic acid transferase [Chlamydiia bacterium]|nr:3-deoxy-D-manno-octulosonic acid transferase [Chlamydiia bacterium]